MTDFIRQLKEQISIADVVGEYVRLKKSGTNYMGLCPFHAERSPSFSISTKKGIFHCFGCQKGGDVISFVQEIQAISFHEAIRVLAQKFQIKLPAEFSSRASTSTKNSAPSKEDRDEIYFKLNRFVAQFYHERLLGPEGAAARRYLLGRGITEATIKAAYLGFAPDEWGALYEFLLAKKAPIEKAEELGLVRLKSNAAEQVSGRTHYDLFRNRVMFPVIDLKGRVVAFGGRALGEVEGPKYLNSADSPIFKKGNHLFGLFSAQKEIRAEDLCVIVEGFMDCLTLQQAGMGYAVATLGTALTERQAGVLKRLTRNIVLLFDGDSAGQEAQRRAMETFLNEDIVVRGVVLSDERDPDEFVNEQGIDSLSKLLKSAPYLLDQRILDLAAQAGGHAEARARAVDQILPWIAKITSDTARIVRIQEVSGLFNFSQSVLEKRVEDIRANISSQSQRKNTPTSGAATGSKPPVRILSVAMSENKKTNLDPLDSKLLESLVAYPEAFLEISDFTPLLDGIEAEAIRNLAGRLFEQVPNRVPFTADILDWTDRPDLKNVLTRALLGADQETTKTQPQQQSQQLSQQLSQDEEQQQIQLQGIKDLEKKLIRRGLERRKESLRAIILKADGSGHSVEYSKLMNEYKELVKLLDETKGGQVNI